MEIHEKSGNMTKDKKMLTAITFLGIAGLILIMISSVIPEKKSEKKVADNAVNITISAEDYCRETEERLGEFLGSIEGAGDVKVYLTVGTNERYVYATEGRRSKSENKVEEEQSYVIVGSGSDKNALIETVETPVITGAVIACTGCGSASVQERIYKAVSAALGLPTGKIYVTELKQ